MVDAFSYRRQSEESSNLSYTNHPSFSSTLLDAIYRSIDQGEDEIVIESMRKKQQNNSYQVMKTSAKLQSEEEMANFQRACMIEKWMEKKVNEKAVERRKTASTVRKFSKDGEEISSSSSWDSSCGGGAGFFSSLDAETFQGKRPKPIRVVAGELSSGKEKLGRHEEPSKNQDRFLKTKFRALKIYSDLRKVKQPISPGSRLAGFLNSLFAINTGNSKKPKSEIKSANTSTCSSASSFSRSCLSKTPSSRGKSAGAEKRYVRFSPVSVIVDEDCGHKRTLHEQFSINAKKQTLEAINEEIMVHVMEKNRRVEEAARDLLRNYQKKMDGEFPFDFKNHLFDQEFEEDDDDAASYASSDLFELDNLSAIGMGYREELPVYETTLLRTNRAIAKGLVL